MSREGRVRRSGKRERGWVREQQGGEVPAGASDCPGRRNMWEGLNVVDTGRLGGWCLEKRVCRLVVGMVTLDYPNGPQNNLRWDRCGNSVRETITTPCHLQANALRSQGRFNASPELSYPQQNLLQAITASGKLGLQSSGAPLA